MLPTEKSAIGTLEMVSIPQTNRSTGNRRRGPLRSRTVDTFLRIMSFCHAHSITLDSDKGGTHKDVTHIGSVTKDDVPLADTNIMPKDSLCQGEISVDETRMALGTEEGGLYSKQVESTECYDNISGERKDLSNRVDTNPSNSFNIEDQDNYDIVFEDQDSFPMIPISLADMMISSPHLPTDKDVEEGEISGEFMDFMLDDNMSSMNKTGPESQDVIGIETGHSNDNNLIPLATDVVDDVGKDTLAVASKTKRNLVDYSEIAVNGKPIPAVRPERFRGRLETAESKHGTATIESGSAPLFPEQVPPPQSNLKSSATESPMKDNGAQNNKKRQRSCTGEEITSKKVKSVDATPCPENLTILGEHSEDASQKVVDASANKDAADENKKKRVLTKERKAKKKRKERIKRAEKNRKLGVKRLKLQPVIKEKKITYCRHYLKGRCHEGEKCKFSHDTVPLTKSKPCCHFARHSCMKGDDCPFDHQLSKYPCNNYISKGFCSRGSDCMFSHEAQPNEAALNASNEPKPEQKPSSLLDNSGSKKHNNVDVSSREKIDKKSCSIPISITSNKERNLVEPTPKPPAGPPKGISFISQEKPPPPESHTSPKVVADVVQDFKEITEKPLVVPRGINFLSFGKKPGLDHSDGGFSFKMCKGIGKSPLSNVEGESSKSDSNINLDGGVKVDTEIGNNNNKQMNSQAPRLMLPFMSISSQRVLHSTLDFASDYVSGVKAKGPEI
ncbi:hypothetical protein L6452_26431 [Arctium lappa]|uniref:Uncharacterized protein n=1 Tax=Arctium lappa TaxID=4217 RepID=A0ACB8ZZ22_ARCLA|nr:hypothetical protein L6452_26431 [Arctium lappa]